MGPQISIPQVSDNVRKILELFVWLILDDLYDDFFFSHLFNFCLYLEECNKNVDNVEPGLRAS